MLAFLIQHNPVFIEDRSLVVDDSLGLEQFASVVLVGVKPLVTGVDVDVPAKMGVTLG